ncbi:MAG TPA: radical SAM protein [Methylomusa anaerophila]|nr:radical SAM protein [Methylomusa anaerophila]HML89164.1 radical SAM protein [Methylomusa anaerophila]
MGLVRRHETGYNFMGDTLTGATFRWGDTFAANPLMAPWPELADISISNYCTNTCRYCYRNSSPAGGFMSLADYRCVLEQLTDKKYGAVFQVALGGGEPLQHPDIIEIFRTTREDYAIIPNYTTSGIAFTPEIIKATRQYCGAVAISYDPYRTAMTGQQLAKLGAKLAETKIKANIHFVLSEVSIDQASDILSGACDEYFTSFNSIVFLTYKPLGMAGDDDCLKPGEKLRRFLQLVDQPATKIKIGFDACFVPNLLCNTMVDADFLDSCECGFFSVYVDENLNVLPCSFCNDAQYSFNLREYTFADIWQRRFQKYREAAAGNCTVNCSSAQQCRGKCVFFKQLQFCHTSATISPISEVS